MVVEQRSGRILGDQAVFRHSRLRRTETFNNILYNIIYNLLVHVQFHDISYVLSHGISVAVSARYLGCALVYLFNLDFNSSTVHVQRAHMIHAWY